MDPKDVEKTCQSPQVILCPWGQLQAGSKALSQEAPSRVPPPGPWVRPHSADMGSSPPTGLNPSPATDELGDLGKASQSSHP